MTEEVTQRLKQTEEMLEKKQEYLEMNCNAENAAAKKHARTNKRLALQALKRRIRVEEQLGKIDGALTILEFQREALENAEGNAELWKILNYAAQDPLMRSERRNKHLTWKMFTTRWKIFMNRQKFRKRSQKRYVEWVRTKIFMMTVMTNLEQS